jgi:hypothetical protein
MSIVLTIVLIAGAGEVRRRIPRALLDTDQSDRDILSPRWPHHQRLTQMRDFYAFLLSEIPALLNRWHHQSLPPSPGI